MPRRSTGKSYWTLRRNIKRTVADIDKSPISNDVSDVLGSCQSDNEELYTCGDVDIDEMSTGFEQSQSECAVASSSTDSVSGLLLNNSITFSDSSSDSEAESSDLSLYDALAQWAMQFNIPLTAVSSLLSILCKEHPELPRDARTLLKTPTSYPIQTLTNSGEMAYFGVKAGLRLLLDSGLRPVGCTFQLQFNIDGVPLFKSSNTQLWPILCLARTPMLSDPFTVAIYKGSTKPPCGEYFKQFVDEMKDLLSEGICYENVTYNVAIHSFVCDAPARAFIKQVKGHMSYSGCERCEVNGEWHGKMTFQDVNAIQHTDDSFVRKSRDDHHIGDSPLQELGFGMVSRIPLDYMHLLCLGVMRRLVFAWLRKGPLSVRIGSNAAKVISDRLTSLRQFIPSEFSRRPRSLDEISNWKATEFRQLLLYTGVTVFEGILSADIYNNFLMLFVFSTILISPRLAASFQLCDYAEKLSFTFIDSLKTLYGHDMIVYNIHSIIHLPSDAKLFGNLDNISAFPFENKLKSIKKLVRKPHLPLQQICRRFGENEQFLKKQDRNHYPKLSRDHTGGPVVANLSVVKQFQSYEEEHFKLAVTTRDGCFMTKDCRFMILCNIVLLTDGSIVFICEELKNPMNVFNYPMNSSDINITKVVHRVSTQPSYLAIEATQLAHKCIRLPLFDRNKHSYSQQFVVLPLLH
jgi:hypothetical protein